jgi:hypothetical protein
LPLQEYRQFYRIYMSRYSGIQFDSKAKGYKSGYAVSVYVTFLIRDWGA